MKKLFIITLLFFISCNNKAQDSNKTKILTNAYTNSNDVVFLEKFPNNFKTFVSYFGWNESLDKPFPLYNESEKYIDVFFELISKKENKDFLRLIVDIGINGKYQADGVNYFKSKIEKLFIKNPNLVCELFKDRNDKEIDSFWYFYLDSPQPLTVIPKNLVSLKSDCNILYKSIDKQLKIIQKENLTSEITNEDKTNKLKDLKDFIPNGYDVLDSLSIDFNKDKNKDKIIILSSKNEFKNNEARVFLLLIKDIKGKYSLIIKNSNVIPCIKCTGGTGGEDSYSDLLFSNNVLSFVQIKIIDTKLLEIKYEFEIKNSELILTKMSLSKSDLFDNQEKKVKKVINNLNINIKEFNYNDFQKNSKSVFKINDPDGFTNLRKEKSSSSIILEKVKTDSEIEVLDKTGDWWLVVTKAGNKGYIFKSKIVSE